jgi:RNA polymerase sigma-70 factor (ECF subfamily)
METDEDQINELMGEYLPKIVKLVKHKINSRYSARFDADDVAATVFRTVFKNLSNGKFTFDDDESLWRQLVAITQHRLNNKIRHADAAKRATDRTVHAAGDLFEAISREPDPQDAALLIELIEQIGQRVDELSRQILELRLSGLDSPEIAERLEKSERTIRRKLQRIESLLEEYKSARSVASSSI